MHGSRHLLSTESFRERLRSCDALIGTFLKVPHHVVVEVLALSGLDVLCLDAEHAPFDRAAIDRCAMAARASGKPLLVRVQVSSPEYVQTGLDCGATGILAPHVRNVEDARRLVRMCRYGRGGRGFSGSTREGGYGRLATDRHLVVASSTVIVAQIEDPEAVENIDAIVAVDGLDAIFIGPADLAMGMGAHSPDDPEVCNAITKVCEASKRHGRAIGIYVPHVSRIPEWRARGATFFLVGSDQAMLLSCAERMAEGSEAEGSSA